MTHPESATPGSLAFDVLEWLGGHDADAGVSATLGSLRIGTGPGQPSLTEVADTIARTVRQHINVPMLSLVRWLLMNWWRLRWEPRRQSPGWREVHSMASIGGGYAWPAIEFSSDGGFVQVRLEAEDAVDVAGIRYLRDVAVDVPASRFEQATRSFVSNIQDRLAACRCEVPDLEELVSELDEERANPEMAHSCRLQAMAGIDPGDATRDSSTAVDLGSVGPAETTSVELELPWQRGSRLADMLRQRLGLGSAPMDNKTLGDLLGVKLPLPASSWTGRRDLSGALVKQNGDGRRSVLVLSRRADNQRFHLARLIGCSMSVSADQPLLPVTSAATGLQKLERAFAQQLLCPWFELDEFTERHGLDDDGIAEAADHFQVSQLLILSTLVKKRKLPRGRLSSR